MELRIACFARYFAREASSIELAMLCCLYRVVSRQPMFKMAEYLRNFAAKMRSLSDLAANPRKTHATRIVQLFPAVGANDTAPAPLSAFIYNLSVQLLAGKIRVINPMNPKSIWWFLLAAICPGERIDSSQSPANLIGLVHRDVQRDGEASD